jgi:hypothetical protein
VLYLEAIENGKFEKLPGGVYTKSYVQQHVRSIDFDEAAMLRALSPDPEQGQPRCRVAVDSATPPFPFRVASYFRAAASASRRTAQPAGRFWAGNMEEMLRCLAGIVGNRIEAIDGEIGKVHDFLFDDILWTVRYVVVESR